MNTCSGYGSRPGWSGCQVAKQSGQHSIWTSVQWCCRCTVHTLYSCSVSESEKQPWCLKFNLQEGTDVCSKEEFYQVYLNLMQTIGWIQTTGWKFECFFLVVLDAIMRTSLNSFEVSSCSYSVLVSSVGDVDGRWLAIENICQVNNRIYVWWYDSNPWLELIKMWVLFAVVKESHHLRSDFKQFTVSGSSEERR